MISEFLKSEIVKIALIVIRHKKEHKKATIGRKISTIQQSTITRWLNFSKHVNYTWISLDNIETF